MKAYFSEIRKYIVYAHLAWNHVMIKLFGEKFVDPLFWIREEVIEIVEARKNQNVTTKSEKSEKNIYITFAIYKFHTLLKVNAKTI